MKHFYSAKNSGINHSSHKNIKHAAQLSIKWAY